MALSRRDLFDARFQLISTDDGGRTDEAPSGVDFVDAPSDLVPGVYEGGLKTWECSIDLAGYVAQILEETGQRGPRPTRFLEVNTMLGPLSWKRHLILSNGDAPSKLS